MSKHSSNPRANTTHLVGESQGRFQRPDDVRGGPSNPDPRLTAKPSQETDDYTVGLLGSEGSSYTPLKLTREQLNIFLRLEDRINTHGKGSAYAPSFVVFHGGIRNVGLPEEPVWEPKGSRVQPERIQ